MMSFLDPPVNAGKNRPLLAIKSNPFNFYNRLCHNALFSFAPLLCGNNQRLSFYEVVMRNEITVNFPIPIRDLADLAA